MSDRTAARLPPRNPKDCRVPDPAGIMATARLPSAIVATAPGAIRRIVAKRRYHPHPELVEGWWALFLNGQTGNGAWQR
jgi:hypothetical protein